ncbi:hypothetical protein F4779DRAFT_593221 [Xylariaceae sp. FL0662B]|nr:hypothetical protein F4779DRAFT_593221 [Xylariaceae sp. FL0662B]
MNKPRPVRAYLQAKGSLKELQDLLSDDLPPWIKEKILRRIDSKANVKRRELSDFSKWRHPIMDSVTQIARGGKGHDRLNGQIRRLREKPPRFPVPYQQVDMAAERLHAYSNVIQECRARLSDPLAIKEAATALCGMYTGPASRAEDRILDILLERPEAQRILLRRKKKNNKWQFRIVSACELLQAVRGIRDLYWGRTVQEGETSPDDANATNPPPSRSEAVDHEEVERHLALASEAALTVVCLRIETQMDNILRTTDPIERNVNRLARSFELVREQMERRKRTEEGLEVPKTKKDRVPAEDSPRTPHNHSIKEVIEIHPIIRKFVT